MPDRHYDVKTWGPLAWQVVRDDGKVVKRGMDVFTCLRWIKAWGDVDL